MNYFFYQQLQTINKIDKWWKNRWLFNIKFRKSNRSWTFSPIYHLLWSQKTASHKKKKIIHTHKPKLSIKFHSVLIWNRNCFRHLHIIIDVWVYIWKISSGKFKKYKKPYVCLFIHRKTPFRTIVDAKLGYINKNESGSCFSCNDCIICCMSFVSVTNKFWWLNKADEVFWIMVWFQRIPKLIDYSPAEVEELLLPIWTYVIV